MKITVAGVGYVGLSLAVLLAQKHEVTAITTTEAKVEKLNQFISPIQDDRLNVSSAKCGKALVPSIFTRPRIRQPLTAPLIS